MHLFYTPELATKPNLEYYTLSEEESKHCIRVLRLSTDDKVYLIDGVGGFYSALIFDSNPKRTLLKIVEQTQGYGLRNHRLHIAVAPAKNIERFEWFLEKATEIGVDEITPIICDRSERKDIKIDRLNKVITSAVKQSLKAYHPKLNEPIRYKSFLDNVSAHQKFIAHCMDVHKESLKSVLKTNTDCLILIGPEGDFSPSEVELSINNSYVPISLGGSRLRTETAALEACFEVNFLNR